MKKLMLICFVLILAACQDGNNPSYYNEFAADYSDDDMSKSEMASMDMLPLSVEESEPEVRNSATQPEFEQKIIKEAEIGYEVDNYEAEVARLKQMVAASKGYVSNENEENSNYRLSNRLVIRVPVDGLEIFMDGLAKGAKKVDYKRVFARDVTEEYVDIKARLKTKRGRATLYRDTEKGKYY